jgi:hypothetical protein
MLISITQRPIMAFLSVISFICFWGPALQGQETLNKRLIRVALPVIWRDPGDIAARDLRYGPGSPRSVPVPPFTFSREDKSGESPKFEVKDARGVKWTVKLGEEAQSETVSTRLVWAAGYFAEEAYYFRRARIRGLPKLSRGREFVHARGVVRGARFEPRRNSVIRGNTWGWDKNPFADTAELDGLKVIMILLNNFDARAENNRILYVRNGRSVDARYVVTDLGATLGKADGLGGTRTKNNLRDFLSTRFVMGVEDGAVKFDYDTRPTRLGVLTVVYPPYYLGEVKKEKSMRGIPVEHARWIGSYLSQLTDEQLRDAFRAAGYDPVTMNDYVTSLRERINQLREL